MYVHVPPLCGFMNHVCHATRHVLLYAGVCFNMGARAHALVFTVSMEHTHVCVLSATTCVHACIFMYKYVSVPLHICA